MSLRSQLERGGVQREILLPPALEEQEEERDWVKITTLVIAILSGLVAALAASTLYGIFPVAIFGGFEGALFTLFGSGIIAASTGGYLALKKQAEEE